MRRRLDLCPIISAILRLPPGGFGSGIRDRPSTTRGGRSDVFPGMRQRPISPPTATRAPPIETGRHFFQITIFKSIKTMV